MFLNFINFFLKHLGEFYKFLCDFNINFQKFFKVLVEYCFAECHRFELKFLRPDWKFCLTSPPPEPKSWLCPWRVPIFILFKSKEFLIYIFKYFVSLYYICVPEAQRIANNIRNMQMAVFPAQTPAEETFGLFSLLARSIQCGAQILTASHAALYPFFSYVLPFARH